MWIVRGTKQIELSWYLSVTNQVTGTWRVFVLNFPSHRNLSIITIWLTSTRVRTFSFLSHQIFRGPFDLTISQEWNTEYCIRVRWLTEQIIQSLSYCWLGNKFTRAIGEVIPRFWLMGTWLMNDLGTFIQQSSSAIKQCFFAFYIIYIYIFFFSPTTKFFHKMSFLRDHVPVRGIPKFSYPSLLP